MTEVSVSWFDRVLATVAPQWAQNRIRARAGIKMLTAGNAVARRHYDATAGGRRTAGWSRRVTDANAAAAAGLPVLRELSRDLRRNNGWARRSIEVIANNAVSWGIEGKPQASGMRVGARALDIWQQWANSTACDFDGRLTFAGLQRLVIETVVESGEAIIVREAAESADGLPVPVTLRVLEPDYLDSTKDNVPGPVGQIRHGIEFDSRGRRIAYHLLESHPGASLYSGTALAPSRRVPAERVAHVYRMERPGQIRGVPWLATAIAKLQDFDDYDDALLLQQKIAACFSAFVQDFDGAASPIGELVTDEVTGDTLEELQPGHIAHLPPGKSITFASPPPLSDHNTFSTTNLRRIASTLGVTYEDLTGDYSMVNFSSARMARMAHWQNIENWRWNLLIPSFCDRAFAWVMTAARAINGWSETPAARWTPPPMPMLEPDKEGRAYRDLIRSGVMTISQAVRERGEDPAEHFDEYAADLAMLDERGIVLDSDARVRTQAGMAQPEPPAPEAPDEGDSGDESAESDAESDDAETEPPTRD